MRILSIHNRYKIRGGEEECFEAEAQLLREYGHEVEEYVENNEQLGHLSQLAVAANTVWSQSAYRKTQRQLRESSFEAVHIHNFLPLISPSVYYAAKSQNVPVVQTLHNYRLLCPNALFFRNGKVCTDCLGKAVSWPGIQHSCYRESMAASAVTVTMLSTHKALSTWKEAVDCYITLTEFARQQFIMGGLPADKIVVKPNFVHPDPGIGCGKGGYALYVGRLSVEKGIDTLLSAWETLGAKIPLKIVGDGPLADEVIKASHQFHNIEWLGRKPMAEVHALMGEAMCLVFPSKWYETFGRVVVEAFAKGTPVVASEIGAISELIESGRTGLLFNPGDPAALAEAVVSLVDNPHVLTQMRKEARLEFETKYTAQENYKQLKNIYQSLSVSSSNKLCA